ncbi:uncharacterized protein KGF55_004666 [Candida pseudojiufengensis]|uniref:uncharacterized protein n=1 Tax=Candida pseudojiufengensis TaxID=497109 RepID=UPI0022250D8C|nr:uncharacterized protein KGF55_004666 [Candida pseudojiufengensis]KAI5960374.1 hypothetical protein KGF55_004666 [Candida pseudojiufengensis]
MSCDAAFALGITCVALCLIAAAALFILKSEKITTNKRMRNLENSNLQVLIFLNQNQSPRDSNYRPDDAATTTTDTSNTNSHDCNSDNTVVDGVTKVAEISNTKKSWFKKRISKRTLTFTLSNNTYKNHELIKDIKNRFPELAEQYREIQIACIIAIFIFVIGINLGVISGCLCYTGKCLN